MNNRNAIKRTIAVIIWILLIVIIFGISVIYPFVSKTVRNIIGKPLWFLIYILLPILTVIVPLFIRYILQFKRKIIVNTFYITIIYVLIVSITSIGCYKYIKNFTPQKWEKYVTERNLMLEDLENKYSLVGMSINEAKEILGNPDLESENEIEYIIGEGFIDPEMFVLKYDEQIIIDFYTYIEFKP